VVSQQVKQIKATSVFYANEKAYNEGFPIICNEGGSRCFAPDTRVFCINGIKPIKDIKEGDLVDTPLGYKQVLLTHEMDNTKQSIRIRFKDGRIIECTDDHLFFFRRRWVKIKDLLSLLNEKDTKL
jgi:hypothetical protein